jgi:hypothetical protein
MTISAVVPDIAFTGSGSPGTMGPFSLIKSGSPLVFYANSEVVVLRYDTDTDTTPTLLVEGTDYTLTGGPTAGVVTLTSPQTGLLTAERLYVTTLSVLAQSLDLVNGGNFSSSNLERRLDVIFQILQQHAREIKSTVRFSMFDTDEIPGTVPLARAIDKIVYITGTASNPSLEFINAEGIGGLAELTEEALADIAVVAADLGGADTIGIVAAAIDDVSDVADNISDIIAAAGSGAVANYAALTAIDISAFVGGETRYVKCRTTSSDGGDGWWRFDSASSATANGGTILAPDAGSGRWLRIFDGALDVRWFGSIADGTTNNSVAVQAAVTAALLIARSVVSFPAGVTKLTGDAITATLAGLQGISFVGQGMGITQLFIDNSSGNGFVVTCAEGNWWLNVSPSNSVTFLDMSIVTNKTNTGTAIMIDGGSTEGRPGAPMLIRNVEIRGHDGFGDCFAKGVDLLDVTSIHLGNVHVLIGGPDNRVGVGFDVRATDATTDPVQIVFDHCRTTYGNIGYQIGEYVEGVYLTQCDAINPNRGIQWIATAESGIHIVGGHYACYERCIRLVGVFDGTITGTLLYRIGAESSFSHIVLDGGGSLTVIGNVMRGLAANDDTGIAIANVPDEASHGIMITGNQFANLVNGIAVFGTTRKTYIGPNNYNLVTNPLAGSTPVSVYVHQNSYGLSSTKTLTGGAATENIDVALPPGQFSAAPVAGFAKCVTSGPVFLEGYYDITASSASSARFIVRNVDGGTLGAGSYGFSVQLIGAVRPF